MEKHRVGAFAHAAKLISLHILWSSLYCREISSFEILMASSSTNAKIRVLLVDDHPTLRQTLRSTLEAYPYIEVAGEASDGEEAIARVEQLQPAVVVMDIYMGRMDGITATRLIKAQHPHVAVIGLTVEQKDFQLYAMHKAGAIEIIGKQNMAEVPAAIQRAVGLTS
jgi:DNA-binding NarL/FixJ family response regulator